MKFRQRSRFVSMKKIDRQLTTTLLVLRIPARTTVRYTDMSKAHHRALIEISSNSFLFPSCSPSNVIPHTYWEEQNKKKNIHIYLKSKLLLLITLRIIVLLKLLSPYFSHEERIPAVGSRKRLRKILEAILLRRIPIPSGW